MTLEHYLSKKGLEIFFSDSLERGEAFQEETENVTDFVLSD